MYLKAPIFNWEFQIVAWFAENRTPFFDTLMKVFTFIGEETFYVSILPIIYWAFSKRLGFQLSVLIGSSIYVNSMAKDLFGIHRPFVGYPDHFSNLYEANGYSLPSGHAQGTLTFWGFVATSMKTRFWLIISLIIVLFVGVSRVYGAVHWPTDILLGWIIALIILVIANRLMNALQNRRLPFSLLLAIAILYSGVLLSTYYLTRADHFQSDGDTFKMIGFIFFIIISYGVEREWIRFQIPTSWWRRILAVFLGMAGILILKEGLKGLLPIGLWSDFIRYGMIGIWSILLLPWLLIVLKIYPQGPDYERIIPTPKSGLPS